jgi:2-polyprenyl-3-methyl-5-hydroxy-6-metoxy-1,4-benzoquinol methylase
MRILYRAMWGQPVALAEFASPQTLVGRSDGVPRSRLNSPAQSGSIDPQAYGGYLRTIPGRLRVDLAWENLRSFLPSESDAAALDVGGGTGQLAVRLAACGFRVTVLDGSEAMLAEAERASSRAHLRHRISLVHGDAARLPHLFSPTSFAVIACHNVIEFVERPAEVLQAIRALLARRNDAVASLIVRNRAGEVLAAGIKNGDLVAAEKNLTAPNVHAKLLDQLVAVFTPQELRGMLASAELRILAEFGIRVFSDYLPEQFVNEGSNYPALLALERKLGARPDFAAIARYVQVIARPHGAESERQRESR